MNPKFPGFSPDALSFLRALKRNNRREWFQPRKEKYETLIVYRIYRDTRFSPDKTPYKTHIAAMFPRHSAVKREGSVFYLHFTEKELLAFGGVYGPDRDELLAYRGLIQEHYQELEEILRDKTLRRTTGGLQGAQLSRMPKGFPVDHPAESLLRQKQWYLECMLDVKLVTSPKLVPELAKRFEIMLPLVEFLNRPFAQKKKPKKLMFAAF